MMYGCEVFGVADTLLEVARCKVAKAASPEACGRNPTLALLAIDGNSGTMDPAFLAHVSPIQHWALAIWDHWFPVELISSTLSMAERKMSKRFVENKGTDDI